MTLVTHRHCREIGYCNRGMRAWCVSQGLDWPEFLKQGISADTLRKTGDAMAARVIAHAEREAHGQQ